MLEKVELLHLKLLQLYHQWVLQHSVFPLMIVVMGAIYLHARWGGICKERGLMALAIRGNIITAWSWFGTNLLGVGLHSYGFTDSGFY